jgi:pectate lyase
VIRNVLSWQSNRGSWPKNRDTAAEPYTGDRKKLDGTFDNGATTSELRFLARAFGAGGGETCRTAFLRGLDGILEAQYPSGGWPQYHPPGRAYHRHITFNDGVMVRLLELLRDVSRDAAYGFVAPDRRKAAEASLERGIACILKCQIVVNGTPTVWCAQHDEEDYRPRPGRSYELVSLSGGESAGVLEFLMSIENPGPETIRAVRAGAAWFEAAKLTGIRQERVDGDTRIVKDPGAPPLWARFYEIGTNRPIFSGRDGVKKYELSQIESERRNGYSWYGTYGAPVAERYARWEARLAAGSAPRVCVVVGDSTVCDYPEESPCRGWGQYLPEAFGDALRVVNLARSGRSTKTFLAEGLWARTLREKPDFVLIQFGHNDSHAPGRPESTDAAGEYRGYLRRFIDEAREAGATPILVTPMHRRTFTEGGRLDDILRPYAEAMKAVAAEKGVAVVDLHTASGELFRELGPDGCPSLASSPDDRTHFNEKGARAMAALVLKRLAEAEPRLAPRRR